LIVFLTAMLLLGDYFIKYSVKSNFTNQFLIIAGLCWVLSIPGWYYTVLEHNISLVGMLFSVLSLVGTASIGIIFFSEQLNATEWLGLALGIISTILLASKL